VLESTSRCLAALFETDETLLRYGITSTGCVPEFLLTVNKGGSWKGSVGPADVFVLSQGQMNFVYAGCFSVLSELIILLAASPLDRSHSCPPRECMHFFFLPFSHCFHLWPLIAPSCQHSTLLFLSFPSLCPLTLLAAACTPLIFFPKLICSAHHVSIGGLPSAFCLPLVLSSSSSPSFVTIFRAMLQGINSTLSKV